MWHISRKFGTWGLATWLRACTESLAGKRWWEQNKVAKLRQLRSKIWRLERKPNLPQDLFFSLQILRFQIVVMSLSAGPIKCRTAFNFASTCLMNPGAKLWQVCRDSWFCCASLCVFMYFLHIWPTLSWFVRFPHRFWHSLNKISSDAEMPALSTISAASWGPFSAEKGVL